MADRLNPALPSIVPGRGLDATSVLTIYVCLLLGIPSAMVVAALGSAGAPSAILAIGIFLLWVWFQVQRTDLTQAGPQPVRAAALVWLLLMVVVYAHAMASPIPADEVSPADNGILKLVGFCGVLLLANDGLVTLERLRTLLRRLVLAVGVIAAMGILQYLTRQLYVDRLSIPGLTAVNLILSERSGFVRPSGTSTHPIEYGVVLTMMLPIAIAFALRSPTRRWLYRAALGAISVAIFLSISRSAMLCAAIALLIMATAWTWTTRLRALAAVIALTVVIYLTVPGMLGTVTNLFTGIQGDTSIASRTGSYDLAAQFISRQPLLGRGFGTFLPQYWILDNGYLGLLIEGGVIGLAGLLVLIATSAVAARRARQAATEDFDRDVAQAMLAAVAAGACSLAFFDTFAFPQSAGCFFLVVGVTGAMRRLALAEKVPGGPGGSTSFGVHPRSEILTRGATE